jgi:hypothetical protein
MTSWEDGGPEVPTSAPPHTAGSASSSHAGPEAKEVGQIDTCGGSLAGRNRSAITDEE